MTLSHLVKYPATAAENEENKGAGVIACTEAKLRPFNSILIFKMRPTAFQQLQANEDFSNTRGRANLCVSICTDEAHVACLHHWQGRHSRPCLRQCPRKINSSTRLVKATALGVRLRIGIFLLLTIFAICHFSYRIEQIWNDMNRLVDELCKVPSKIKTHARLRCNGGLETQLSSMISWSILILLAISKSDFRFFAQVHTNLYNALPLHIFCCFNMFQCYTSWNLGRLGLVFASFWRTKGPSSPSTLNSAVQIKAAR